MEHDPMPSRRWTARVPGGANSGSTEPMPSTWLPSRTSHPAARNRSFELGEELVVVATERPMVAQRVIHAVLTEPQRACPGLAPVLELDLVPLQRRHLRDGVRMLHGVPR